MKTKPYSQLHPIFTLNPANTLIFGITIAPHHYIYNSAAKENKKANTTKIRK